MLSLLKAIRTLPAEDWRRAAGMAALTTLGFLVFPAVAAAQAVNINLGNGAGLTDRVVQLIGLMTVLSLAPSIVIMTTSFVRIVVVLSLLRTALGLQQSPPNAVIISLSLFLTAGGRRKWKALPGNSKLKKVASGFSNWDAAGST